MRIAVYPGSFDPVTNGHIDIIARASRLFDKLIVTVSRNYGKQPLFTVQERMDVLKEVLKDYPNVSVDYFDGLTVNYAEILGAQAILRGLRATSDFESEFQMALTNRKLKPKIDTVFLMTRADYSYLSSSVVKELAMYGGCVEGFVPDIVETMLKEKYAKS